MLLGRHQISYPPIHPPTHPSWPKSKNPAFAVIAFTDNNGKRERESIREITREPERRGGGRGGGAGKKKGIIV